MENFTVVKAEWKSGVNKKTEKPWTGLEITFQGSEKFTVTKLIFLSTTECQLLGISKPVN